MNKIIVASDLHGPEQCADTVQALFSFTDAFKPDKKIFLGDLFDLTPLMGKASQYEKERSIEQDISIGIEFLNRWKPDVYLLGNHCQRLLDAYEKPGNEMLKDLIRRYINMIDDCCEANMIKLIPHNKNQCYTFSGVDYIHGFAHNKYAANKHSQHYENPTCAGHVHKFQSYPSERAGQKGLNWTIGCLCKESLSYDRKMLGTISHESGFAYGIYDEAEKWTELYPVRRSTGFKTILDLR